jgi:hypothetical protein
MIAEQPATTPFATPAAISLPSTVQLRTKRRGGKNASGNSDVSKGCCRRISHSTGPPAANADNSGTCRNTETPVRNANFTVPSHEVYSKYLPREYPPEGSANFSFGDFFNATCQDDSTDVNFNQPKPRAK